MTNTAVASIESWLLTHSGVTFTRHEPALPLRKLDLVASMTNQSRDQPIDQPTVDRYVAALDDGALFPSIIVRDIDGQLVILGGNHRTRAHVDAKRRTIDAVIVTCDNLTALEIAYGDNATHGLPPTDNERLAHALVLVDQGRTARAAARTVGIDPQRVHRRLASVGVEKRAARAGVAAELTRVSRTVHPRLASLRGDQLFAAVVRTFAREQIPSTEQVRIIGDLNEQPTVDAAIDLLQVNVSEHRRAGGGTASRTVGRPAENPRIRLLTALGTIRALAPGDIADACHNGDHRTLHEACIAAGKQLMAIDAAVKKGATRA